MVAIIETGRAKIIRRLEADGWVLARHGSEHDIYRHPLIPGVISVPRHKSLTIGVSRQIAKAATWILQD